MNNTFLYTAFTTEEQKAIAFTTVKTSDNDEWVAFEKAKGFMYDIVSGGPDTMDRVFLLSLEEAMAYGGYSKLANFYNYGTDKLKALPTRYAFAQGTKQYEGSSSSDKLNGRGCCRWWLRSPGSSIGCASVVRSDGGLVSSDVDHADVAVRPAFWLDLDSMIP